MQFRNRLNEKTNAQPTHTMITNTLPSPRVREFLPQEFKITVWSKLKPYYNELLKRPIHSQIELERWILDNSELDALFEEELNRRYIAMVSNPDNDRIAEAYIYTKSEIKPHIQSIKHQLNEKFLDNDFSENLDDQHFETYYRTVKSEHESFHKNNLGIHAKIESMLRAYKKVIGSSTFSYENQIYNLTQAKFLLESTDRISRKKIYKKVTELHIQNAALINSIFGGLIQERSKLALNAGYDNYRNYRFNETARYDYTSEDCHQLHELIAITVCPIIENLHLNRKQILNLDKLRPWDLNVTLSSDSSTNFEFDSNKLIQKTIACLDSIHPFFGNCIQKMYDANHLKIDRSNETPFTNRTIPLPLTSLPYLYLNTTTGIQQISTFLQLCGQAVHLLSVNQFDIHTHRQIPSELSSLSAFTMQLLAFENGELLFNSEQETKQAKKWVLENILIQLPWIATFDRFQHWVYKHPEHSQVERDQAWQYVYSRFHSTTVDFEGSEEIFSNYWHTASNLFNTPFNYIENAFAIFGAIAIWKQYQANPEIAIEQFKNAMEAGYTQPINKIYNIAGIQFYPSEEYIESLVSFVQSELKKLD